MWSPECHDAFRKLKEMLTTSPVLAYPEFGREFILEMGASAQGIGAVLGQHQDDNKLHPVAYASRALNVAEKHYGITELETLAVVWAVSHFHHYLYGNTVTVYTDHTAVKAQTPQGSMHAGGLGCTGEESSKLESSIELVRRTRMPTRFLEVPYHLPHRWV